MYRERLKSIVWFWLFKSFQTVIGGSPSSPATTHGDSQRFWFFSGGRQRADIDDKNRNRKTNDNGKLLSWSPFDTGYLDDRHHHQSSSSQYIRLGRFPLTSFTTKSKMARITAATARNMGSSALSTDCDDYDAKAEVFHHSSSGDDQSSIDRQSTTICMYPGDSDNDDDDENNNNCDKDGNDDFKDTALICKTKRKTRHLAEDDHHGHPRSFHEHTNELTYESTIMKVQTVGSVRTRKRASKRKIGRSKTVTPEEQGLEQVAAGEQPNVEATNDDFETIDNVAETMARQWTQPIIPMSLSFDGDDSNTVPKWYDRVLNSPDAIDSLASYGFEMATQEQNDWIEWKIHESSRKLLEKENNDEMAVLEKGEVLVYIGKAKCDGHGSHLPIIKTKSIIPLSSREMAELLMDSSRVQIYNKMSVGRSDLRVVDGGSSNDDDSDSDDVKKLPADSSTKVVCNLTQPPVAKSQMVSCTLMHSRKLLDTSSVLATSSPSSTAKYDSLPPSGGAAAPQTHLVVSRAMPGMLSEANDPRLLELPRNDILLGVNLLQDLGPNECLMTAVTHVYSPALPAMLAKSMGVSSAVNFVKDIRKACTTDDDEISPSTTDDDDDDDP